MKNPPEKDVKEFLRESNAIERVYDEDSFNQAMVAWDYLYNQSEMSPSVVLKTHKILMLNQVGLYPDEKGYFRNIMVYVGGKPVLNAVKIRDAIDEWCEEMNQGGGEEQSKWLHVGYEKIHPFVDGNGRTGRMFMNWWRVKKAGLPILIIHEGDEQMQYYKWFN